MTAIKEIQYEVYNAYMPKRNNHFLSDFILDIVYLGLLYKENKIEQYKKAEEDFIKKFNIKFTFRRRKHNVLFVLRDKTMNKSNPIIIPIGKFE